MRKFRWPKRLSTFGSIGAGGGALVPILAFGTLNTGPDPDQLPITCSDAGNLRIILSTAPTPLASDVVAGVGAAYNSGAIAVTAGAQTADLDFVGTPPGIYYLHGVLTVGTALSAVQTIPDITIAGAGISIVGSVRNASGSSATPPAHAIGDIFIVFACNTTGTIVSDPGAPWALLGSQSNGSNIRGSLFWKTATTAAETVSGFTSANVIDLIVYRGASAVGDFEVSLRDGASSAPTIPALTLANASSRVFCAIQPRTAYAPGTPSGYNVLVADRMYEKGPTGTAADVTFNATAITTVQCQVEVRT